MAQAVPQLVSPFSRVNLKRYARPAPILYKSFNTTLWQDIWKLPGQLETLSEIAGINLHDASDEVIEHVKEIIRKTCRGRMLQMNNLVAGIKFFTDDADGFRITDEGRAYLKQNFQTSLIRSTSPLQLDLLIDLYRENPFSFFGKVTAHVPMFSAFSKPNIILKQIASIVKQEFPEYADIVDRRLNRQVITTSNEYTHASVTTARIIMQEANIPLAIKEDINKNIIGPNGVDVMRKNMKLIIDGKYKIDNYQLALMLGENDPGIYTTRYTSTALKNATMEEGDSVDFVEEYGEEVESAENAFMLFIKNIEKYGEQAAESFGYRKPYPALPYTILVFDDAVRNGIVLANTPVTNLQGDNIFHMYHRVIDGNIDDLYELMEEGEIDSGGIQEANERRRQHQTRYLGTRIYLFVRRPHRNRVGSFNKCFLPSNLAKLLKASVDIPENKDDLCLLDSITLWAKRKGLLGTGRFDKAREVANTIKNRSLLAKKYPELHDFLVSDVGRNIFVDGLINKDSIQFISDKINQDISIYRLAFNNSYDNLQLEEPEKYCEVLSCYNTRKTDKHKPGIIELLVIPDESDIWDITTYKKHQTPHEKVGTYHIGYVLDIMTLIRKITGLKNECFCECCRRYFGHKETYDSHMEKDPKDQKIKCRYSFKSITYSKKFNIPKVDAMQPAYIISSLDFEAYMESAKGTDMGATGNKCGIAHYHNDLMNRIDACWVDKNVDIMSDEEYKDEAEKVEAFIETLLKIERDYKALKIKGDEEKKKHKEAIENLKETWPAKIRSRLLIKYLDNIMCKTNTRINFEKNVTETDVQGNEVTYTISSAGVAIMILDKQATIYKLLFSNSLICMPYDDKIANKFRFENPTATPCGACGKMTEPEERVVHHNHVTGEIVFISCCKCCNRKLRPKDLTVLCHNAGKYDNHFILNAIKNEPAVTAIVKKMSGVSKSMGRHMKLTINDFSILDTVFYEPSPLDSIGKTSLESTKKVIIEWEKLNPRSDKIHNIIISSSPFLMMKAAEGDAELMKTVTDTINTYIQKLYKTQSMNFDELGGNPANKLEFLNKTCKKLPCPYEYVESQFNLDDSIFEVLRYNEEDGTFQYDDLKPELKDDPNNISEYKRTRGVISVFSSKLEPELKSGSKDEYQKKKLEEFKSNLNEIVAICKLGNIKTLGQYYKTYLLNDTSQLLDWGLVFGNSIYQETSIYPFSGICSTAGTAYYAGLLSMIRSGVTLDAYDCNGKEIADKIHDMFNKGLYGGIASVTLKNAVAKFGESILIPFDANSLYPSNMQLWIPTGDFNIATVDETIEPKVIIEDLYKKSLIIHKQPKWEPKYLEPKSLAILDVDGYFPISAHKDMREYCMFLEHFNPHTKTFSKYQKETFDRVYRNGKGNTDNLPDYAEDSEKLMATMYDRKNQVIDIEMIHYMMTLGFVVTKIHEIVTFTAKRALKPFMDKMNRLRENAKTKQEQNLFKTISNSFYGRCCMRELGTKINFYVNGPRAENKKFSTYTKESAVIGNFIEMKEEDPHITSDTPRFISIFTLMQTKRIMLEAYMLLKKSLPSTQLAICDTDSMYVKIQYKKDNVKMIEGDITGVPSVIRHINNACNEKNEDGTYKYHSGHFFNPYDIKSFEPNELLEVVPDEIRYDKSLPTYLIDTSNLKDPLVKAQPAAVERGWNAFKFDKPEWLKEMVCLGPKVYCCKCHDYKYEVIVRGKRSSNFEAEIKALKCKAVIDKETMTDDYLCATHSAPDFGDMRSLSGCEIKARVIGLSEEGHDEKRMKGIKKAFAESITIKDYEDIAYYDDTKVTPGRLDIDKIGCFRVGADGRMATMVIKKVALTDFDNKKWCPKYLKDDPDQFRYNFGDIAIAVIEAIGNQPHSVVDRITDQLLIEYGDEKLRKMMSADFTYEDRESCGLHAFIKQFSIQKLAQ